MPRSPAQSINLNENGTKRKRRPAGTPDPDAEVVALSPATLMESDRYICDICGRGFQRDQNLQMHRRRHKVPWKLLKRRPPSPSGEEEETGHGAAEHRARKRVYVCPEPSCLHHDRRHALGDLVGIKKHFRRKHSDRRQWVCPRCSKGYAVQSDYKAHLKTCGSRGHSCDCGRVFSRVENFIEHQDSCNENRATAAAYPQTLQTTILSDPSAAPATSPSSDTNQSTPPVTTTASPAAAIFFPDPTCHRQPGPELELQVLPAYGRPSVAAATLASPPSAPAAADETALQLSIAPAEDEQRDHADEEEQMKLALKETASADEARRRAKEELELAERQLADAKTVRRGAREELEKAYAMRAHAVEQMRSVLLQITCRACRQQCQASSPAASDDVTTAGPGDGGS